MSIYWTLGLVVAYIIGAVMNYGLLLGHYHATMLSSEVYTKKFKKEAMFHSLGSWLCLVATYPAVEYGKYGVRFK